jgi:hypothetical protein
VLLQAGFGPRPDCSSPIVSPSLSVEDIVSLSLPKLRMAIRKNSAEMSWKSDHESREARVSVL